MPVFTPTEHDAETSSDGKAKTIWLSESGGLTHFGASLQTLAPGGVPALAHWHSDEDELAYVLSGQVTVHEGDHVTTVGPGYVVTFKAGLAAAHYLENRGETACTYVMVGTRAKTDIITYPEHDRVCVRARSLPDDIWQTMTGKAATSPY
jgi:uncharacterized cupin superfamily protein